MTSQTLVRYPHPGIDEQARSWAQGESCIRQGSCSTKAPTAADFELPTDPAQVEADHAWLVANLTTFRWNGAEFYAWLAPMHGDNDDEFYEAFVQMTVSDARREPEYWGKPVKVLRNWFSRAAITRDPIELMREAVRACIFLASHEVWEQFEVGGLPVPAHLVV
jgi:hypothetical protein